MTPPLLLNLLFGGTVIDMVAPEWRRFDICSCPAQRHRASESARNDPRDID